MAAVKMTKRLTTQQKARNKAVRRTERELEYNAEIASRAFLNDWPLPDVVKYRLCEIATANMIEDWDKNQKSRLNRCFAAIGTGSREQANEASTEMLIEVGTYVRKLMKSSPFVLN